MRRVVRAGFRATLFWTLLVTLGAMVLVERGLRVAAGAVATRAAAHVEGRLDDAVQDLEDLLTEASGASEPGRDNEREPGAVFAPVPSGPELIDPVPWAPRGPGWATRTVRLQDGAIVTVDVPLSTWERFALRRDLLELLSIVPLAAIALATATVTTHRLMRPIRALTRASDSMAAGPPSQPVPIPPGDDELARLASAFERARDEIRVRVERERTFTRYVSHELRTPLSALKLQLERARQPNVGLEAVLPRLERNVLRIEEVIAALTQLARSSDEWDGADRRYLADIVQDAVANIDPDARARVTIANASPADTVVRSGRLLGQALANLLDNAVGHGAEHASLRIWVDQDGLEVRVVDDGPGILPSHLARVTEPFYRGSESGTGLGLGLALVSSITEALHGDLILRNREPGFEAALRLPGIVVHGSATRHRQDVDHDASPR